MSRKISKRRQLRQLDRALDQLPDDSSEELREVTKTFVLDARGGSHNQSIELARLVLAEPPNMADKPD